MLLIVRIFWETYCFNSREFFTFTCIHTLRFASSTRNRIRPPFVFHRLFSTVEDISSIYFSLLECNFDFWVYARWLGSGLWNRIWLPWATILKTLKWRSAFKENATAKHCQGKKPKSLSSFLQNLLGASSLCVRDEVFWTEDLIEETYETTSRLVHNCNPYWTWHVCPIEQFSTHSYTSSLRPVLHMLAFKTKMLWRRVPPTLNFRKVLPILILTGGHKD